MKFSYESVKIVDKNDREAYFKVLHGLYDALKKSKKYRKALLVLDKLAKINPKEKDHMTSHRLDIFYEMNNLKKVLSISKNQLLKNKNDSRLIFLKIAALTWLGHNEKSILEINKALKLFGNSKEHLDDKIRLLELKVIDLIRTGKFQQAIDLTIEILPNSRKPTTLLYNRACAFSILKKFDAAIADLSVLLSMKPEQKNDIRKDSDFKNIRNLPSFKRLIK